MSNNKLDSFLVAIKDIVAFTVRENGMAALPASGQTAEAGLLSYSMRDLYAVDARLPAVVTALAVVVAQKKEQKLWCNLLRATIQYWRGENIFQTRFDDKVPYLWFNKLRVLGDVRFDPQVMITAVTAQVRQCYTDEGNSIDIINKGITREYDVSLAWLDEHYPHWRTRYEVAAALGYTDGALKDYVLVCADHVHIPAVLPTTML